VVVPVGHTVLAYVFEGEVIIAGQTVTKGSLARLDDGDAVELTTGRNFARALLLGARPLREPVVTYGPFVMNTVAEIEQAIHDYRSGRLTA
jgi:redox-sensitive bicupin YhaK (pirin superfamily)